MKLLVAFILLLPVFAMSQSTIDLYTTIPNSKPSPNQEKTEVRDGITLVSNITRPTLTCYTLPGQPAAAVLICPGGGYWVNAISHEGFDVAKAFNAMGIAAFVLKYRIPNEATMIDKSIGPLQDAQQAIKLIREHAKEWNIDPSKVGIMGFSAGGHLASTAATHFTKAFIENTAQTSLRPDFQILIYPVISFDPAIAHMGSREQLIGKNPKPEQVDYFSNERQVTTQTPPAFLVHATDDDAVPVANSVKYYEALHSHHVDAEIHVYEKGEHGFGMNNPTTTDRWMERLQHWLMARGIIN